MKNSPIHAIDEALFGTLARRYLKALKKRTPGTSENLSSVKETLAQAIGHANYHAAQAWWQKDTSINAVILGKTSGPPNSNPVERSWRQHLLDFGFDPTHVSEIDKQINLGAYAIVAGTAGRGKSLTAMALLSGQEERHNVASRLFTVEEPPEYIIPGSDRSHKPPSAPRHKPRFTSEWTPKALETLRNQHEKLVFSSFGEELHSKTSANQFIAAVRRLKYGTTTVHASSAFGVIDRMDDFGVANDVIDLASNGAPGLFVYQNLLPKLCQTCCVGLRIALSESSEIEGALLRLAKASDFRADDLRFINRSGCLECNGTGTSGRTAVAEIALFDKKAADVWVEHQNSKNKMKNVYLAHRSWLDDVKQMSLVGHALSKVLRGQVDLIHVEEMLGPIRADR